MDHLEIIADGMSRGRGVLRRAIDGLDHAALQYRPAEHTNPIGWLAWHIARIEDMHVADLLEEGQLWTDGGWHERFGMPSDARDFGTRQTLDEPRFQPLSNVGVRINSLIHHAAHHGGQIDYLRGLRDPSADGLA